MNPFKDDKNFRIVASYRENDSLNPKVEASDISNDKHAKTWKQKNVVHLLDMRSITFFKLITYAMQISFWEFKVNPLMYLKESDIQRLTNN